MTADAKKQSPTHVYESQDGDRNFVFHLAENDIFIRTGRQLIEASELNISIDLWREELDLMFGYVKKWCEEHATNIRACLCEPRRARLVLHFLPKTGGFDFDLADGLADLDMHLSRNFKNVGLVEAGQIPWDEMDRFVNHNVSFVIYGEIPGTQGSVGT